jgi:hypothetical protein
MSVQDLGSLADYVLNGDNYERVQPDGSVLIIPGQHGRPPLSPAANTNEYFHISDCPTGNCALVLHDAFTGFYSIQRIATFDPITETCACALLASFERAGCGADLQAFVDSLVGVPESSIWPPWFIQALGLAPGALFAPDFWFIACYDTPEVLVGLLPPPPPPVFSCAVAGFGDVDYVNGQCPSGYFADPALPGCCKPLDPPAPALYYNLAGPRRSDFAVPPELAGFRPRLSSTRFEPSVTRSAPPPPLPAGAEQPLPPGNCGCSWGTSDEIDEL